MLSSGAIIGIFLLLAIMFPIAAMATAWPIRRKPKQTKEKLLTYECGVDTIGKTWLRFRINYFLYALVFLAFTVQTIFVFPWAVTFNSTGIFAFLAMIVFLGIVSIGLWYAWKERALEWY